MNKPYEDNAKQVTVTGWACKHCGRFHGNVEISKHLASYCCCDDWPCKTKNCKGRAKKGYDICYECRHDATNKFHNNKLNDAMLIEHDNNPIYDYFTDKIYDNVDSYIEEMEDEGDTISEYVFSTKKKQILTHLPNIYDLINDVLCDLGIEDGVDVNDFKGIDKLKEAFIKFKEINNDLVYYDPDFSRKIKINE